MAEVKDGAPIADANADAGGDQETVESLRAALESTRAEAAKYRSQKIEIAKERDALKKAPAKSDDGGEDYKSLWTESQQKTQKMLDKVRNADINAALTSQLTKVGVRTDAMDAAAALVDRNIIKWDEDDGLEQTTVEAAIQLLKGKHKFLFEKHVPAQDGKVVVDGTNQAKTLKRAEFDRLDPFTKAKRMADGYKLVD